MRNLRGDRIWWLNPSNLIVFIILPIFGTAILLGAPIMSKFGSYNFLNLSVFGLAFVGLSFLALGTNVGTLYGKTLNVNTYVSTKRLSDIICIFAGISIVMHLILMGQVLTKPGIILQIFMANKGAIYQSKALINQVTGLTSFTQTYLLVLPLYGIYPYLAKSRPSSLMRNMVYLLLALLMLRAFVMAERFVIIEAFVSLLIPRLYFIKRGGGYVKYLPIFGFLAVLVLFIIGEYTRSWPYYRFNYNNFWEFVYVRLVGYLATATNNGAGVYETAGALGMPYFTAGWFHRFPLWAVIDNPFRPESPMALYFQTYGNAEFNNPSGIYAPYLDYGYFLGALVFVVVGFVGGLFYTLFRRCSPYALILFPTIYLGYMIINQAFYWSDSRLFTVYLCAPFVHWFITKRVS